MNWKRSSVSAKENCVELAHSGSGIAVRDSKDPGGPVLTFPQLPSGPPSIVMATRIMQAPNAE
nr:DUF397 domain-containing protein [Actinophytocola oryzae]